MASIVERKLAGGKKSYQVTIRLKGFHTQTASFARMTDAKRWAGATEAAMREGRYFRTSQARKHTLSDLIDRYIKEVIPSKGRFGKDQETQLKWWKDQLGPYLICDIAPAKIAEGRDRLLAEKTCRKKLRSPATVVRYLAALSHAFSVAVKEWEWISENPVTKVRKPREPEGRTRFLDPAEIKRLMDTCRENPNPFLYPIVVLALSSGMRFSEILRLHWEDIDLERQLLVIKKTKNKERRTIPLAGPALELLRELESQSPSDVGLVFTVEGSKKPVDIRNAWLRAKVEAEISNFRFHDLRHTAASYLAMNGATTLEIAEILGHKTLAMVKRYAHLSEPHTRGVIESLVGKLFDGKSEEGGDDPVVKDGAVLYRTAA